MPQYVDRPLPETLELPRLQEPRPRYNGKANLRFGPGTGRRKGNQDKITKDLKLGLIEGAVQAGFDGEGQDGLVGYCRWMAMFHPKTYATLLVKLLPYNIHANTPSTSISSINIVGIPSGLHLTPEQMEYLQQPGPHTVDHEPAIEQQPPSGVAYQSPQLTAPIEETASPLSEEQELEGASKNDAFST